MTFTRSSIPGEDIRRAMEMPQKRRELINDSPADLPVAEYGVNRLARALHPGLLEARIVDRQPVGKDCWKITFRPADENGRFPYFRAGQFVTLSAPVHESYLSRPYSIASSPKQALEGRLEIIVQRQGIFSSWLIDEAQIGSKLRMSEPSGDFCHDDIRDGNHILAVAGGSGITPFISMMKAIREGSEDFRITVLYGVRTRQHLLIDPLEYSDGRMTVIPVLSDEETEDYINGFINADLLRQHIDKDTSVFMCGPNAMYDFVSHELQALDISRIRKERNCAGDRLTDEMKIFRLRVHIRDGVYDLTARSGETLITALERAGIPALVRCRSGVCGFCHSRLISGQYLVEEHDDFRRQADRKFGYIHPCVTYPLSDLEIDIPVFE